MLYTHKLRAAWSIGWNHGRWDTVRSESEIKAEHPTWDDLTIGMYLSGVEAGRKEEADLLEEEAAQQAEAAIDQAEYDHGRD